MTGANGAHQCLASPRAVRLIAGGAETPSRGDGEIALDASWSPSDASWSLLSESTLRASSQRNLSPRPLDAEAPSHGSSRPGLPLALFASTSPDVVE
jgi:hypothetical protein